MRAIARRVDNEPQIKRWLGEAKPGVDPHAQLARFNIAKCLFPEVQTLTTVGRFTLGKRLGLGGMGAVYLAEDPKLGRTVAVKLVPSTSERQHQILREAESLAQIHHPNVVTIFDADITDNFVYFAMEYIEGSTIRQWMQTRPSWREVLRVFLPVIDAMASVHDADIVHGDFKPENILLTETGIAKIADFGLASIAQPAVTTSLVSDAETMVTGFAGTPGYMAPEQVTAGLVSAKSDQYSLCVCLFEALYGTRPQTPHKTLPQDRRGKQTPAWLHTIVQRGLAEDPTRRFSNVRSLQRALQDRLSKRAWRRRIALATVWVALGAGAVVASAALLHHEEQPANACTAMRKVLKEVDDPRRLAQLQAQVSGTNAAQWPFLLQSIRRRHAELISAGNQACTDTDGPPSAIEERQAMCLRRQALDLDAALNAVDQGISISDVHTALDGLESPTACAPSDRMLSIIAPPGDPSSQAKIDVIDSLARQSVFNAGSREQALQLSTAAVSHAGDLDYSPLIARARLARARALDALERHGEAREELEKARDAASDGHDQDRFIMALIGLGVLATTTEHISEADVYLTTAKSLTRAESTSAALRATLHSALAQLATLRNDLDDALTELDSADAVLGAIKSHEKRIPLEIRLATQRGAVHFKAGRIEAATGYVEHSLLLQEERYGPAHPTLALSHLNLLAMYLQLGKLDDAAKALDKANAAIALGDQPEEQVARRWFLTGLLARQKGRSRDALQSYQRALPIMRKVFGDDHGKVWALKNSVAIIMTDLEQWDEARKMSEDYLTWALGNMGPLAREVQIARLNVANVIISGDVADEFDRAEELLKASESAAAQAAAFRANILSARGNLRMAQKRWTDAARAFGAAERFAEQHQTAPPTLVAFIVFRRAEALWEAGRQSVAIATARRALALYKKLPERAERRAEVSDWIDAHMPSPADKKR